MVNQFSLTPLPKPHLSLFWGAPLATDSEFSPEDPLALDYLSQQLGLWLLPRFTTRTGRAQYYAVVVYGLYLAERALHEYGEQADDNTRRMFFERWERFWALSVLESLDGYMERGHPDGMRGIQGAKRAWRPGESPLSLNFTLISRQSELGGLGAYLSSLRASGLVIDGTLRPSPLAQDLIDAFWGEPGERDHRGRYEGYALTALNPKQASLNRKQSNLTLARLGEVSRLTAIRTRPDQQGRLFDRFFGSGADPNARELEPLLRKATQSNLVDARGILTAATEGRLGTLSDALHALLRGALAFGDVAQALLSFFNRAYGSVWRGGWMKSRAQVASESMQVADYRQLQGLCRAMLKEEKAVALRSLPVHGAGFVRLVSHLSEVPQHEALDALLDFHREVQRDRRGTGSWLITEGDELVLGLANYQQQGAVAPFPDFKLGVLRSLLMDLGRISPAKAESTP